MKKVLLFASVLLISASCTKTWNCTITTDLSQYGLGVSTVNSEFSGTKQEMKDFEDSAVDGQTIECK